MAGGVGPSSLFVASGEGPSLLFISGGVGPRSPLVCGGVGPSLPFAHGGLGPSFTVHSAGGSLSFVDGAAGGSLFFMGGGAGGSSHCLWVVVGCPHLAVSGWWWCTLISFCAPWYVALITVVVVLSPFKGEGGGWSFVFAGTPSIVDIIQCWHRPASFLCAVVVCHPHRMSSASRVLVVVVCPHCVVVSCPPCHCPMLLLLPCPRCDVSFGCTMWHLC